ncbi:MAG: type III restriction endonuclease subunit R, partial [Akkermansiaceae bacterium]
GRYKDKVIQVDSSKTGADEEKMIADLLTVEHNEDPTEIVIHVNMLKEGWDVTNLYTIVPLRAANARILIEQSIGRGLRLPYGRRVGVAAVDRLSLIAHDKFQEIVDDARRPDSAIKKLHLIELDGNDIESRTETVVSQSNMASKLGLKPAQTTGSTHLAGEEITPAFETAAQQRVAQLAYEVIKRLEAKPNEVPTMATLETPAIQSAIVQEVAALYR